MSSAIRARGASTRTNSIVRSTWRRSTRAVTPASSWPACTMTSEGAHIGQPFRLEQLFHRAEAVGARRDVAGPGDPVDDGVPAQLPRQVGGPGEGGVIRPDPGRVGRSDDRHRADVARPALDPLLAPAERIAVGERPDLVDPRPMTGPPRIALRPAGPRWPRRWGRLLGSGGSRLGRRRLRAGGNGQSRDGDGDAAADQACPRPRKPGDFPQGHTSVSVSIPHQRNSGPGDA